MNPTTNRYLRRNPLFDSIFIIYSYYESGGWSHVPWYWAQHDEIGLEYSDWWGMAKIYTNERVSRGTRQTHPKWSKATGGRPRVRWTGAGGFVIIFELCPQSIWDLSLFPSRRLWRGSGVAGVGPTRRCTALFFLLPRSPDSGMFCPAFIVVVFRM